MNRGNNATSRLSYLKNICIRTVILLMIAYNRFSIRRQKDRNMFNHKFTFSRCIRIFLATFVIACIFQFVLIGMFSSPNKFNLYHAIVQKQKIYLPVSQSYQTDQELIEHYFRTKTDELMQLDRENQLMHQIYEQRAEQQNRTLIQSYNWTHTKRLPYFFDKNDAIYPDANNQILSKLAIWPEDTYHDRIINQMMYIPENYDRKRLNEKKKLKKILIYPSKSKFSIRDLPDGQIKFLKDNCPVNTCEITRDRDQAETADAILFKEHINELTHNRSANQIWVFYTLESPSSISLINGRNLINWTATYRLDSDLVTPYAKFVKYNDDLQYSVPKIDYSAKKSDKAAWFVSNCGSNNRRNRYAQELKKYFDIDIYGRCGPYRCPKSKSFSCFMRLKSDYKFYLSFENSNCRDYITEKFYLNALQNNVVPIVLGPDRQSYNKQAPYFSFIHVDEFNRVSDLSRFLKILNRNSTLYNSYFRWKNTGEFVNTFFWCRFCALLHAPIRNKTYKDLREWWTRDSCDNLKTFKYIKPGNE